MTRWPSSSDSWLSKNAPLSRRFSKKRLMDCSRHAERPNNARPTALRNPHLRTLKTKATAKR